MAKELTELQERILARVISMSVSETLYLCEGHVNSVNNLKKKGFIDPNAYSWLNTFHVTEAGKSAFFSNHELVFAPKVDGPSRLSTHMKTNWIRYE